MQTLSEKRRTAALKHWECEGRHRDSYSPEAIKLRSHAADHQGTLGPDRTGRGVNREQGANMSEVHQELETTEYFATCGGTLIRIGVPVGGLTRTSDGRVLTSWLI